MECTRFQKLNWLKALVFVIILVTMFAVVPYFVGAVFEDQQPQTKAEFLEEQAQDALSKGERSLGGAQWFTEYEHDPQAGIANGVFMGVTMPIAAGIGAAAVFAERKSKMPSMMNKLIVGAMVLVFLAALIIGVLGFTGDFEANKHFFLHVTKYAMYALFSTMALACLLIAVPLTEDEVTQRITGLYKKIAQKEALITRLETQKDNYTVGKPIGALKKDIEKLKAKIYKLQKYYIGDDDALTSTKAEESHSMDDSGSKYTTSSHITGPAYGDYLYQRQQERFASMSDPDDHPSWTRESSDTHPSSDENGNSLRRRLARLNAATSA